MSRKLRLVTTAIMAFIMCGAMSFLVTAINRGVHIETILPWLKNWVIAVAALYPVSYTVTPFVSRKLQESGLRGRLFHAARAVILGSVYALWMTFVMTAVNAGFSAGFLTVWMKSFRILVGIAAVLLYFLIPPVQRLAKKICEVVYHDIR